MRWSTYFSAAKLAVNQLIAPKLCFQSIQGTPPQLCSGSPRMRPISQSTAARRTTRVIPGWKCASPYIPKTVHTPGLPGWLINDVVYETEWDVVSKEGRSARGAIDPAWHHHPFRLDGNNVYLRSCAWRTRPAIGRACQPAGRCCHGAQL